MTTSPTFRCPQKGATLVELVITIVIISVAIAGVVGAFGLITGRSADPLNQTRAVALAQIYMDEILSRRYDEDTPVGGVPRQTMSCDIATEETDRADYDDVDDYNAISGGAPENAEGTALIADYANFQVAISVKCAGNEMGLPADDNAKRIDLTVTDPSGNTYDFSAYRANY